MSVEAYNNLCGAVILAPILLAFALVAWNEWDRQRYK